MNKILDVRHIPSCTQQIAQTKKMLRSMSSGEVLTVQFLDEMTLIDFKSLCHIQYTLLDMTACDGFYEIKILL